jgi:hypothetical protein
MDEVAILFLPLRQKDGGSDKNFSRKDTALSYLLQQLRPEYLFGYPNSLIPTHISRLPILDASSIVVPKKAISCPGYRIVEEV